MTCDQALTVHRMGGICLRAGDAGVYTMGVGFFAITHEATYLDQHM